MSDPEGYRFLPHDQQRCQCEGCQRKREVRCVNGHTDAEHWQDGRYSCPTQPGVSRVTADVTREPTGGQGLREVLARDLAPTHWPLLLTRHRERLRAKADGILALPTVAALIADAERVRRVRDLAEDLDARGVRHSVLEYAEVAADLRRALDGEPQP